MKKIDLAGIFPPIVTPFKKEEVAYDYLVENINKWNNSGLKGFVVLGSNGENVFLSEAEKIEVVKTVIKNRAKDKIIIVGSGCESARETIYLTNRLAASGAQAALIVTPFYYGGKMNDEALIKYYTVVADNAEIPVLLYNVPKFTGVNINPGVLSVLAKHPNIIGIKDSSGNVNQLGQYLNEVDDNFNILVGTAGSLLGALTLGCKGGILALANIVPEKCVEIQQLIQAGKLSEARALQLRMIPVNHATTTTYGISGLKYAMDLLGYKGGETRLPLLPLKQEEKEKIRNILVKASLKVVSTP